MPRLPRIYFEGALYYVVAEAGHNSELFKDNADYNAYLTLVNKYKTQYQFKLFAFVLMSNQINLLIEPLPETTISQIMHDINSAYTKYFNGRYEKAGHLFRERFRAILIEKETYLTGVTRFIHLLPVDAHLAKHPADHYWSSYKAYLSNLNSNIAGNELVMSIDPEQVEVEVEAEEVLLKFSLEIAPARLKYQEFVEKSDKKEIEAYKNKLYGASVIGTKEFLDKVKESTQASLVAHPEQLEDKNDSAIAPALNKKINQKVVYVFSVIIILFFVISGFLLKGNVLLKREIKETALIKDEEMVKELIASKKELSQELEEKYRADMVSYKAAALQLKEIQEKNKVSGEKR